jgi:hypothetical protein
MNANAGHGFLASFFVAFSMAYGTERMEKSKLAANFAGVRESTCSLAEPIRTK